MVELFAICDLLRLPDRSGPDWHVTVLSTPHASQVERTDSPAVFAHCYLDFSASMSHRYRAVQKTTGPVGPNPLDRITRRDRIRSLSPHLL